MSKFLYVIFLFSFFLTLKELKANNKQKKYELYSITEKSISLDKNLSDHLSNPIINKRLANIKWNIIDSASKKNNLIWEFTLPEENIEYKKKTFFREQYFKKN